MRTFVAFQVKHISFQCKVLLLGFSLAPRVFAKMTLLAVQLSRQGVNILMYLNDWLVTGYSQQISWMVTNTINISAEWGFKIDLEKCNRTPSKVIHWLGIVLDTQNQTLVFSEDNRSRIHMKLLLVLASMSYTSRKWESLDRVGQLCCRGSSFGPTSTSISYSTTK